MNKSVITKASFYTYFLLLGSLVLTGCSKQTIVSISGTVIDSKHGNQPLNNAQISDIKLYDSDGNILNSTPLSGVSDQSGKFTIHFNSVTQSALMQSFTGKISHNCSGVQTANIPFSGKISFFKSSRNGLTRSLIYLGSPDGAKNDSVATVLYDQCL